MRTATRTVVASLLAVPLAAGATLPATAWSKYMSRDSGQFASAQWIQHGEMAGVEGNVHIGYLDVRSSKHGTEAWAFLEDYACDEGESPYGGHEEHEEPEPGEDGACDFVGFRELYGQAGQVTLTVDKKLTTARVTGALSGGEDHGGSTDADVEVDLVWTGVGGTFSSRSTSTFVDDGVRYRTTYAETSREAVLSGTLGGMAVSDDADDESWGWFGTFRSTTRESTR